MNNNHELNRHKKSDTIKWIVVFVLITILFAGMAYSLATQYIEKKEYIENNTVVEESIELPATLIGTEKILTV